jgi:hypothetical protein
MTYKLPENIEKINKTIELNAEYKSKNLKKTINNAYFAPNTTMLLNNEVIESMIINDGMFIKIENPDSIEDLNNATLEFNYDFFDHKIKLKLSIFDDLLLVEKVVSSEHNYQAVNMIVNDYAKVYLKDKEIIVNIVEISENFISFNTLKKDEDIILENLNKKTEIYINSFGVDLNFVIQPDINRISDSKMNYKSQIFFETTELANEFNIKYIEKVKNKKKKEEREVQIHNTINELLALK